MQLTNTILLFAGLAVATPLGTLVERQASPRATLVEIVVHPGTGCPVGSFLPTFTGGGESEGLSAQVLFFNYNAAIGPDFPGSLRETQCTVDWIVNFPIGCTRVTFDTAFSGAADDTIGSTVTATLNAPESFSPGGGLMNGPRPPLTTIVPVAGSYTRADTPNAVVRVINQNERNHTFSVDTTLSLQHQGNASGQISLTVYTFSISQQGQC